MYYDILARIKNAVRMEKERIVVPFTKFNFGVLQVLVKSKFVKSIEKRAFGKRQVIDVVLNYPNHESAITDFKILSKPSRRLYKGYGELNAIRQNFGITVLSTPKGVMSNHEARKQKVGGEVLFEIW